jgi:hypothetical protein
LQQSNQKHFTKRIAKGIGASFFTGPARNPFLLKPDEPGLLKMPDACISPANKKQITHRQPLLPEKLFWEYIIEGDRVRYGVKLVALCASQAESPIPG